jgi:hypothetical protein
LLHHQALVTLAGFDYPDWVIWVAFFLSLLNYLGFQSFDYFFSCLGPLVYLLQKKIKKMSFQSVDYERI